MVKWGKCESTCCGCTHFSDHSNCQKRLWNFNFAIFSLAGVWALNKEVRYLHFGTFVGFFAHLLCPTFGGGQPTTIMGIRASYKININKFCCAVMRWITLITVDGHPFYHTFGGTTNAGGAGWIALATPNKFHFPRPTAIMNVCVYSPIWSNGSHSHRHNRHITMSQLHIINSGEKRRNIHKRERPRLQDINSIVCNLILIFPFMNTLSTRLI